MSALPQYDPATAHRLLVKGGNFTILNLFDSLPWFKQGADWTAWRAFLAATFGLQMTQQEYALFRKYTHRINPPTRQVKEVWAIVGRRGRKSAIGATIGVYMSAYRDYSKCLAPGERARALMISKDKDDAGALHGFASAILHEPAHAHLLEEDPSTEDILLTNRTEMKIKAFSLTAGRSRSVFCGLLDECAFFSKKDSAVPDEEVLRGLRPAMANIPGALLVGLSSPYAKSGVLYDRYENYYGKDDPDVLVWQADTLAMHDTEAIRVFVKGEYEQDPVSAEAEVGGQFRADVKSFISAEVINACLKRGTHEIAPDKIKANKGHFTYHGFVDVSGGSSDEFTAAVAHWDPDRDVAVLDALRAWGPDPRTGSFSPKAATIEACTMLKSYRLAWVSGDHYAGRWPQERFREGGLGYEVTDVDKNKIYRDALPILNSHQGELLDDPVLLDQLKKLERRITPVGREIITHPAGAHDDRANAACGALRLAYRFGKNLPKAQGDKQWADTSDFFETEVVKRAQDEAAQEHDEMFRERWWEPGE